MSVRVALCAALVLLTTPCLAGAFEDGVDAYGHGRYAEALKLFEAAARTGSVGADHNLGFMYHSGQGTLPDDRKAMDHYRRAADRGFAASEYNVGVMYENGEGVKADPTEATRWITRAAEHGSVDAQIKLAESAFAANDMKSALRWYSAAGEQGHAGALFNLGSFYFKGYGVPKDGKKAYDYYKRAAEAGNEVAQRFIREGKVKP